MRDPQKGTLNVEPLNVGTLNMEPLQRNPQCGAPQALWEPKLSMWEPSYGAQHWGSHIEGSHGSHSDGGL